MPREAERIEDGDPVGWQPAGPLAAAQPPTPLAQPVARWRIVARWDTGVTVGSDERPQLREPDREPFGGDDLALCPMAQAHPRVPIDDQS